MTKPLCIYHGGCADGFTAAWAVWRSLGGIEFYPAKYGEAPPDVTGRDLIMVDFSYKRPVIDQMAHECRTMLILDHHATAMGDLAGIQQPFVRDEGWDGHMDSVHNAYHVLDRDPRAPFAIFDMNRSGAQIAWDFFHPNVPRPALVEHVADRDLWRFDLDWTREISAAIYSREFTFDNWEYLDYQLEFYDGKAGIVAEGMALLRQHDKNVASVIRTTRRVMKIGGYAVPAANAPHFLASDAGNIMSEGQPFAATWYDTEDQRVFSLRSRAGGIDVSEVAASYGGGGHRNAAGFQMPRGWDGDE